MQEQQVSIDGVTRLLPRPFMVLATQNPIEYEGTFPLPEAQLDRFLMRLSISYPSPKNERTILTKLRGEHPIVHLQPVNYFDHHLKSESLNEVQHSGNVKGIDLLLKL